MKKNNLPEVWCVCNDGSQRFKDTVISYINTNYKQSSDGSLFNYYYGVNNRGTANLYMNPYMFGSNVKVLTINEFITLSKPIQDGNTLTMLIPDGKRIKDVITTEDEIVVTLENTKKSLKWEDLKDKFRGAMCEELALNSHKQVAKLRALAKLMIIADEANEEIGWTPGKGVVGYYYRWDKENGRITLDGWTHYISNAIIFKTEELAEQAYKENKEVFETFYKP